MVIECLIVPYTDNGAAPTITASVNNMGCANIVSLAHFPIPGAIEIIDYGSEQEQGFV